MKNFSIQIKVRYCETDQMGLVHHGSYINYFEEARIAWISNLGFSSAFELMPFENSIVVLELSGFSIMKMIDYLRKVKLQHPISGLQITLNNDYSVNEVKINGVSIENEKKYYVATTDYLLEGGDKMYFLAETTKTTDINYKMRDILIDYFKKYDTLKLKSDNRFIRIK